MDTFKSVVEIIGMCVDGAGVLVIVAGFLLAAFHLSLHRSSQQQTAYKTLRQDLGRAILLGLELLVAADIIRTVVVEPSLLNVAVLGGIVLIRTFLSMSLQVELEGRWPWQRREQGGSGTPAA